MLLSAEKNEIDTEWRFQKNRTDDEAIMLRELLEIKCPYEPGTDEHLEFWEKTQKEYCEKLGGISLYELYHKINVLGCMVDSNEYAYTLRMISDLNDISYEKFELSIAHNNKTGNQKYTYLTYYQNSEIKNMKETLMFMDAELYSTSYKHNRIQHILIIKDKQKEKRLYHEEIKYKKM